MCPRLRHVLCLIVAGLTALLLLAAVACSKEDTATGESFMNETADVPAGVGPGTAVGSPQSVTASRSAYFDTTAPGYITFVVNVHDTAHVDESADTILRLIDIYERYGVRGDFYLTAPIVRAYSDKRPEVIERLKNSDMTISYHVRPPHPLYSGFDERLQGLDASALAATLRDYETYGLDLATGDLLRDQPGGYSYVASVFERDPVSAPAPNKDPEVKAAAQQLYASLGARMTLLYHEEGTDPDQPFVWVNGLLVRPSDFSITRWDSPVGAQSSQGGRPPVQDEKPFWWNMLNSPQAEEYNPTTYLQQRLSEWNATAAGRPPIITSLIHENNFARSGPEGWTGYYFSGGENSHPLKPPFNLSAPDSSSPRSAAEQETIWAAYEEMVAWASINLRVVTSEDLVGMAGEASDRLADR